MSRATRGTRRDRRARFAWRGLLAGAGVAAVMCGARPGSGGGTSVVTDEWFRSPVSGTKYVVEHDTVDGSKWLTAPDGERFPSVASILEAETSVLPPLELRMTEELRGLAADPERAEELVNVTCIYRNQPLHDAGAAARTRANPRLQAELARQRFILGRIAPLRTLPGGRAPDAVTAMKEEVALLTEEEKTTLREVRDNVRAILAQMRREALAAATGSVEAEQRPLADWIRDLPGALDLGGTVVLNARSARIPAGALLQIAERFPEVMHIRRVPLATGNMDTAATSVGAGSWWNAGYAGSSGNLFASIDTGVDAGHPALTNAVAASGIYHTTASTITGYADSTTSADDLQGHGTTAAGILCSTDTTYPGMASGAKILNAKGAFYSSATGASSMYFSDGRLAADWAANQGATAFLLSFGGTGTNNGTDEFALWLDAAASGLGISGVVAAKNYGPNSGTLGYPGCGFNVLTVGNYDDNGTTSLSDDSIYSTSGRGPTSDGRQKPDIAGPGVNITTCAHDWETTGTKFVSFSPGTATGTSTVGPIVCGALGLLQDYGAAAYPEGLRALLLTTANNQSPYKGPDNDWGFGALDCGGAYTYRGSVHEGELTSSGPTFVLLRGGSLASGGRATLAWNRQVTANGSSTPTTYYGLQDLDLYVYDGSDGSELGSSKSTVDPTEQFAVTSAVTLPVYKVVLASGTFTTSYSTEPFAVAAESTGSTTAADLALECTFTEFEDAVAGSTDTVVTVEVANAGNVPVFAPTVTLKIPAGYTVESGDNPQTLSDVVGGSTGTATWTVRSHGGASSEGSVSVDATSSSYGETIDADTLTETQIVDKDPPSATVAISGGTPYTSTRDVTVTLSASDALTGVAAMRVRNAGEAWGSWKDYATSVSTTLSAGDGVKTFEAEFVDGVGNVTATISDSIAYDTTAPTGTVRIQGDAEYTGTPQVTLTLDATDSASGVADMRFSNDGGANWTAWVAYTATTGWTVTAGEGSRTVHAQFRDGAGRESDLTSDTIIVDPGVPSGSVVIADGAAWTTTRAVKLTLSATDSTSGVKDMRLSDLGRTWGDWLPYATSADFTLTGEGVRSAYVQFRDGAGNVSEAVSDTISVDTVAPAGTLSISGGAPFSSTQSVTLTLAATDVNSGVSQMRFSNDASNWGPWGAYATSASWTLTPGDGTKQVSVQYMDGLGNVSSPISDTIAVDTVVPTGTVAILGGRSAVNSSAISLDLTWLDAGSDVWEVRLSNDGTTWSDWTGARAQLDWTIPAGDGAHVVYVQFRDRAGNVSQVYDDAIDVDTVVPSGTFVLSNDAVHVMPWETLVANTDASDGPAGSGVTEFRSSADGGATWSEWALLDGDAAAVVPRPADSRDRRVTILGEVRDAAGNVSAAGSDAVFLVDDQAPSVTLIASAAGTAGLGGDRDAVRIGLVAGDRLTLKLKTKPLVKKSDVKLDIDVYGPDRALLVSGRYPATSRKPGVSKFTAPATGEYWIVVRAAGTSADTGIGYTMAVGNTPAKGSRARKGTATSDKAIAPPSAKLQFDAAGGLVLGGTLVGATTGSPPTLLAPDGSTVPVAVLPGKNGSLKLVAVTLGGGTGTYTLSIPAADAVTYNLKLTAPKPGKLVETPPAKN